MLRRMVGAMTHTLRRSCNSYEALQRGGILKVMMMFVYLTMLMYDVRFCADDDGVLCMLCFEAYLDV